MSHYRRLKITGACYFFTVVTYRRRNLLTDHVARSILREAFRLVQSERPFEMPAICLLPDHLHCIWQLPPGDHDYSVRWALIKRVFTKACRGRYGKPPQTNSQRKRHESGIWQRRFWEHRIRDEDDYWNHVHYIHFNPVKHGLVKCIEQWPYSTCHRFCENGFYGDFDWDAFGAGGFGAGDYE